jgi:TonB family protein
VRRIRTETAKLTPSGGKQVETPRSLLEVAAYDVKGNKIDNAYYPSSGGALTGKEVYQYDDKGNITEMSLFGTDGTLLSKETYSYEFDGNGNWIKMTTSVAVVEGGKISFEPSEITYRTITYYLGGATPARPNQLSAATNGAASLSTATVKASNNSTSPASAQPNSANGATEKNGKSMMLPSASSSLDKAAVISATDASFSSASSTRTGSEVVALEAEPPAKPFRRGPTRPISGGVLNGTATDLPKPAYPEVARRARSSGLVTVEVVVDEKGHVISAHAVKGPTLLQQAAEAAAMQARFSPTLLSGQAVKVSGIITYNFVYGGQ